MANWVHSANDDQLTYEIHMSTTPGFTPISTDPGPSTTYIQETTSNFCFIRTENDGTPLDYTQTYYVRIVMKDLDGRAVNASAQNSATVPRVDVGDIQPLVAGSAFIDTANIVDAAITNAKIGTLAVDNANINQMAVDKLIAGTSSLNVALIGDATITSAKINTLDASKITTGQLSAARIGAGTISASTIIMANSAASILRSSNYVAGTSGWQIKGNGDAEFNQLDLVNSIDIGGSDTTSFHVDSSGNMWLGNASYGSAPFRVSNGGNVVANNLTVTGTHNIQTATQTYSGTTTVTYNSGTNVNVGGNVTLTSGGVFRTASSGRRAQLDVGGLNFTSSISGAGVTFAGLRLYGTTGSPSILYGDDNQIGIQLGSGAAAMELSSNNAAIRATGSLQLQSLAIQVGSGTLRLASGAGAGLGINANSNAFCKPVLTAGTPEVLRHAAGANVYGVISRASSSVRYKDNIDDLDVAESARIVREIKPINFTSIIESDSHLGKQHGYSAENVAEVCSDLAYFDEDDLPSGVNHTMMAPHLWRTVQDLLYRIEALEALG